MVCCHLKFSSQFFLHSPHWQSSECLMMTILVMSQWFQWIQCRYLLWLCNFGDSGEDIGADWVISRVQVRTITNDEDSCWWREQLFKNEWYVIQAVPSYHVSLVIYRYLLVIIRKLIKLFYFLMKYANIIRQT